VRRSCCPLGLEHLCDPSITNMVNKRCKDKRDTLTKGTKTSIVGIVSKEPVSKGQICPRKYVTREIVLVFPENKGLMRRTTKSGRAQRKNMAPELILRNCTRTTRPDCMRSMEMNTIFSWTCPTRYCERSAPMFSCGF
jgi:hypothetical protein